MSGPEFKQHEIDENRVNKEENRQSGSGRVKIMTNKNKKKQMQKEKTGKTGKTPNGWQCVDRKINGT